jgi:pimeloyl-ACP methyl ester carboxylesterase
MNDKWAQIADVSIHYVEEGEGPLVVMLHGFPEFWYSWRKQIPALAAGGYRVIAPDLRGYGDSSKPRGVEPYKITAIVQDVAGLIVQNGGSCILVGHDWGGVVAWLLPMLHPELVERLVVMNSAHPVPLRRELKRSLNQKLRFTYAAFFQLPVLPELFLRLFGKFLMRRLAGFSEEDVRTYADAWRKPGALTGMLNYYRAMRRHSRELRSVIRKIDVPTMLVWGDRDPVFRIETTRDFGEWVPDLRVEHIETAGHFVQTDAAKRVNELLLDFLRSPPRAAGRGT